MNNGNQFFSIGLPRMSYICEGGELKCCDVRLSWYLMKVNFRSISERNIHWQRIIPNIQTTSMRILGRIRLRQCNKL